MDLWHKFVKTAYQVGNSFSSLKQSFQAILDYIKIILIYDFVTLTVTQP